MKISNDLIELWTPLLKGLDVGYPEFALDLVSSIVQKLVSSDEYVLNEQAINPYVMFVRVFAYVSEIESYAII
jgi:hypothetical protein